MRTDSLVASPIVRFDHSFRLVRSLTFHSGCRQCLRGQHDHDRERMSTYSKALDLLDYAAAGLMAGFLGHNHGPFSQRACGEHLHLFGGRENIVAQYGVVMLPTYILSTGFADSPRFSWLWRMVGPISGDFLVGKWIVRNSFWFRRQ